MDSLFRDLRYGLRTLVRTPIVSLVAVLTLALGIGANTAIFSVVDGIMFRPLPYPEPDRLVAVWADFTARGGPLREWLSYPAFVDLRDRKQVFEDVGVYRGWVPTLTGAGDAASLLGADVTAGTFSSLLRVAPIVGRTFSRDDDRPGAANVVILSHGLWNRAFAGDPSVLGREIRLDGVPYTVIGVMPADFRPPFLATAEVWRPLTPTLGSGLLESRGQAILRGVARLRSGVSLQEARSDATVLASQLTASFPEISGVGYAIFPLRDDIVASARSGLQVLLGAVGLILLIACVNVANLLLARGASRRGELAVRVAMGAGRWRIVRQLLTESLLLAGIGGGFGLMLAVWGTQLLVALAPDGTPRLASVSVDLRVMAFATAVTLVAGLAFGLLPALRAGRTQLSESLKEGGRGADAAAGGRRIQDALVVSQVALALTLLIGAGLLLRSFKELNAVDLGFETDHRISLQINLPGSRYGEPHQRAAFYTRLLERVRSIPGVRNAAATSTIPMTGNNSDVSFTIDGRPIPQPGEQRAVWYRRITPGYFDVMGIQLVAGRPFTEGDDGEAPRVVIINETMARHHFPDRNPIGQRINLNDPQAPVWREIVGVVHDVKNFGIRSESRDALYLPYLQSPALAMSVVARVTGDPATMTQTVRREIAALDPLLAATGIATLDTIVSGTLASDRFVTALLSGFAVLALVLALIGLYSVVSYAVTRRLREVGIRMALGARSYQIVRLILMRSLALVGGGTLLGVVGSLLLSHLMEGLLFGVRPGDPLTIVAVAFLLVGAAIAAAAIPARRAVRLDAMTVLRTE